MRYLNHDTSRCPACDSAEVVQITPMRAGPGGWGGRCKACGERWVFDADAEDEPHQDELDEIEKERDR